MKNNYNINLYKKSQQSVNITKSPHQIVKFLMENLLNSMKNVVYYDRELNSNLLKNKKLKTNKAKELAQIKSKNASKALTIIYSLQVSLDFDRTPDISKNLFQIYEFCRIEIINTLLKKTISGLNRAIDALQEILNGWKEIKPLRN